jgi:hypothetical protein
MQKSLVHGRDNCKLRDFALLIQGVDQVILRYYRAGYYGAVDSSSRGEQVRFVFDSHRRMSIARKHSFIGLECAYR